MTQIVTKQTLQIMLNDPRPEYVTKVIGRALVAIYNGQTEDEKQVQETKHSNGVGFTGSDAKTGTITARYYLRHKTLLPWQLEKWLKKDDKGFSRIAKYHSQLNQVAKQKKAS